MQTHEKAISLLNDLIFVNKDRIADYQKAIDNTAKDESNHVIIYSKLIDQSLKFTEQLKNSIYMLAGQLQNNHNNGTVYTVWNNSRNNFFEFEENSTISLAHCEHYRKAALKAYNAALLTNCFDRELTLLLENQKTLLNNACEAIKDASETKKVSY